MVRGRFWRGKRLRKNTGEIVELIALVRGSVPRTKSQPQLSSFSLKVSRLKLVASLWPLTNEIVANFSPKSISELENFLIFRCQQLLKQQDLISGLTCFHWWPLTRTQSTACRAT